MFPQLKVWKKILTTKFFQVIKFKYPHHNRGSKKNELYTREEQILAKLQKQIFNCSLKSMINLKLKPISFITCSKMFHPANTWKTLEQHWLSSLRYPYL